MTDLALHPLDDDDRRTYLVRAIEAHVPRKVGRDILNRLRFGRRAPLSDMPIFAVPREITEFYAPGGGYPRLRRQQSGLVLGGDWDLQRTDVEDNIKLISCRMRWEGGADWQDTPVFRWMLRAIGQGQAPDACRSPEDVARRYGALDRVFEETRARGRLLLRRELPGFFRREHGAVLLHVARDGTLLRAGGGQHRFAIAKILDLPEMPAQLGVVHRQALDSGVLERLRVSRYAGLWDG